MKKFFIVIAAVLSMQGLQAQSAKSASEVKAAIETAKEATENPKKSGKPETWMKLGACYVEAYTAAQGNSIVGTPMQESDIMMAKTKLKSTSKVEIGGKPYTKKVYGTVSYYFNQGGILEIVETTKPIVGDALGKAYGAYIHALKVDEKGKKLKDITAAVSNIEQKYKDEAYTAYQLGKLDLSSVAFEKSANVSEAAPLNVVDTLSIYNAGFTALIAGNTERAKQLFDRALEKGYRGENGEIFAKLAEIAGQAGDKASQKAYLEQGFEYFPESEQIIIGLINYYLTSEGETDQLFALMEKAKAKDPKNASLYSVEGNIREKLGQIDKAVECWRKCVEINPDFADGYFFEGYYYMKDADAIAEEANALPGSEYKKYEQLMAKYMDRLRQAIPLMEKAYDREKNDERKNAFAGLIKNASFRLRNEDSYKAIYEKYSAIYKQ